MDYYQPPYQYNNGYEYPGGGYQPKPSPTPLSVASLVLGIISDSLLLITCCMFSWISIVGALIGLILGVIGNRQAKTGVGTAGIITCTVGLILSAVMIIVLVCLALYGMSDTSVFSGYYYT